MDNIAPDRLAFLSRKQSSNILQQQIGIQRLWQKSVRASRKNMLGLEARSALCHYDDLSFHKCRQQAQSFYHQQPASCRQAQINDDEIRIMPSRFADGRDGVECERDAG